MSISLNCIVFFFSFNPILLISHMFGSYVQCIHLNAGYFFFQKILGPYNIAKKIFPDKIQSHDRDITSCKSVIASEIVFHKIKIACCVTCVVWCCSPVFCLAFDSIYCSIANIYSIAWAGIILQT